MQLKIGCHSLHKTNQMVLTILTNSLCIVVNCLLQPAITPDCVGQTNQTCNHHQLYLGHNADLLTNTC
jgi:hypothetical protein